MHTNEHTFWLQDICICIKIWSPVITVLPSEHPHLLLKHIRTIQTFYTKMLCIVNTAAL